MTRTKRIRTLVHRRRLARTVLLRQRWRTRSSVWSTLNGYSCSLFAITPNDCLLERCGTTASRGVTYFAFSRRSWPARRITWSQ